MKFIIYLYTILVLLLMSSCEQHICPTYENSALKYHYHHHTHHHIHHPNAHQHHRSKS